MRVLNWADTFAKAKQAKIKRISAKYSKERETALNKIADETERETWSQQYIESYILVNADKDMQAKIASPILDALIISRGQGEDKLDFAKKVIEKATEYAIIISEILGKQKQEVALVENAKTYEELDKITI